MEEPWDARRAGWIAREAWQPRGRPRANSCACVRACVRARSGRREREEGNTYAAKPGTKGDGDAEREGESGAQPRLHLRGTTPLRTQNRRYGIAAIAATNKIRVGGTKASPRRFRARTRFRERVLVSASKLAATSRFGHPALSSLLLPPPLSFFLSSLAHLSLSLSLSLSLVLYFSSFSFPLGRRLSVLSPLEVFGCTSRTCDQPNCTRQRRASDLVRFATGI